jgi:hypothetical protein
VAILGALHTAAMSTYFQPQIFFGMIGKVADQIPGAE